MRKKQSAIIFFVLVVFLLSLSHPNSSLAATSTSLFKSKYPKQTIRTYVKVDLDKDHKSETVILTKQGKLYLVKGSKITYVAKGLIFEDADTPKLSVFNPAKGEYQIITRNSWMPGSERAVVYRMQKGKLVRTLDVTGDISIRISKNKIYQVWKKYRMNGGWDPVTVVYTWDNHKHKFIAKGVRP
ncbi:hypothetical protein [Neobacillus soli]|uniref:hypothetical protein n=1 Tax=Neobacillus soli TaxID=220688 RepID=UPI000825991C|nr:hypothetical protein [Neobacillus soli]